MSVMRMQCAQKGRKSDLFVHVACFPLPAINQSSCRLPGHRPCPGGRWEGVRGCRVPALASRGEQWCPEQPWCTLHPGRSCALLLTSRGTFESRSQMHLTTGLWCTFHCLCSPHLPLLLSFPRFLSDSGCLLRHPSLHHTPQDHPRFAHSTPWTTHATLRLGKASSWVFLRQDNTGLGTALARPTTYTGHGC